MRKRNRPGSVRLRPLGHSLPAVAARLGRARALFVGTDLDGTLAPIAARPERVVLPERARRALARLARLPGVTVAVLSGRRLADLQRHVRGRRILLCGSGGLETRDASGRRRVHVAPGRRIPAALPARLAAWCAGFAGAWLEDKGLCFTLHFRAVPARRRRAFVAGARRLLAAHRGRVEVLPGKRVLEVRPAGRADKAAALARWLARRRRTAVIYVGDDLIDEPAHVLARRRDGIAVAVGRTRSRAEYGLRTPAGVAWFLEWLARAWSRRHAPGPTPGPRSGFPRPRPPDAI